MIKSKFTRAILPLAFTTIASGGMFVKTAVDNKNNIKIEQQKTTNPIKNPTVLGTIFTLGLLGTVGAATLGKAVDIRYQNSHEKINDLFDIATLSDSDYQEAFEDKCKELDKQGIVYDKEEIQKQYKPKSKEEVLNFINDCQAHIRRVTTNCQHDKRAGIELNYLIEEIKSAVKYGYDINNDGIKYQMLYRLDKATLPKKEWLITEKKYKNEHPDIDFDKQISTPLEKKWHHMVKVSLAKILDEKEIKIEKTEDILTHLQEIKRHLETQPEILNQYDRKECLERIEKASYMLKTYGNIPNGLLQEILNIYVANQRSY